MCGIQVTIESRGSNPEAPGVPFLDSDRRQDVGQNIVGRRLTVLIDESCIVEVFGVLKPFIANSSSTR